MGSQQDSRKALDAAAKQIWFAGRLLKGMLPLCNISL
jgi:hypothetical protein